MSASKQATIDHLENEINQPGEVRHRNKSGLEVDDKQMSALATNANVAKQLTKEDDGWE